RGRAPPSGPTRSGSAAAGAWRSARCAFPSASSTSGPISSTHSQAFQQAFAAGETPAVLLRPAREFGIDAERGRRLQRPVRIEERLASDGDEIGAALLQRLLGLLRGEDQAYGHRFDISVAAHSLC